MRAGCHQQYEGRARRDGLPNVGLERLSGDETIAVAPHGDSKFFQRFAQSIGFGAAVPGVAEEDPACTRWRGPCRRLVEGLPPAVANAMCVDVPAGQATSSLDLVQYTCHGGDNQLFRWNKRGLLEIKAHAMVLDRPFDGRQTITEHEAHGNYNQRFVFVAPSVSPPRAVTQGTPLVNGYDGSCVQRDPATGNIRMVGCTGADDQSWTMQPVANEWFVLRDATSGQCADVSGGSTDPGASLGTYVCFGGNHQLFRWASDGTLEVRHTAMTLERALDGTNRLVQQPHHGNTEQQFTAPVLPNSGR